MADPEFEMFKRALFELDGVVGVSGPGRPTVMVESDEHALRVRRQVHPSIPIVVTGKLWKEIEKGPVEKAVEREAAASGSQKTES